MCRYQGVLRCMHPKQRNASGTFESFVAVKVSCWKPALHRKKLAVSFLDDHVGWVTGKRSHLQLSGQLAVSS